jgi:hypothetical protein
VSSRRRICAAEQLGKLELQRRLAPDPSESLHFATLGKRSGNYGSSAALTIGSILSDIVGRANKFAQRIEV